MHDEPSRSPLADLATARQDRTVRQAVLVTVIDLHPVQVTVSELARQLTDQPDDFSERDAVERAVSDLAGIGLLHRHDFRNRPDALVAPTQAALVAHDLFDEGEGR
ncbi:MAG TPA: hypothetical protein VF081_09255 [Solirubrobacterales bacterium]